MHAVREKFNVNIFESSNLIGGRCRSFFEKKLNLEIDNGNHLVFSANENFYELCRLVDSCSTVKKLPPYFQFYDLKNNHHWDFDFSNRGVMDLFLNKKTIPNSNFIDFFSVLKFLFVAKQKTVKELVGNSKIFSTLWDPLTLGVMNTSSELASARILSNVLKKTIFKGERYCHIYQPKKNWNDSIINPCKIFLNKSGCEINLKNILKKIEIKDNHVTELKFINKIVSVKKNDIVLLAIPPSNFIKFFPEFNIPQSYNSIVNIHFKISKKMRNHFPHQIIGFINSLSHWIFIKEKYLSVTISNANYLNNENSEDIAKKIWKEICSYLNIRSTLPNYQVVKEKKATIVQSPDNFMAISKLNQLPSNLKIAGDWTQTNLPCTIEGSILSGKKAITGEP